MGDGRPLHDNLIIALLLQLPDRLVNIVDCVFDDDERAFYQSVEEKVQNRLEALQQGDINKAYTSIAFQTQTKDLTEATRPTGDLYGLNDAHGGRIVVFPGGIPLVRDGVIVGAIGVSTGSIEEDQTVAEAGAAAL